MKTILRITYLILIVICVSVLINDAMNEKVFDTGYFSAALGWSCALVNLK